MSTSSASLEASHRVAFRMNQQDKTDLLYICTTEVALGQATALANIPITGNESHDEIKHLLHRSRDLLKRLDGTAVHRWELPELVPASDLASETRRADGLRDSLATMTRLAD